MPGRTTSRILPDEPRAVIFDLDGVLVDSAAAAREAFALAHAEVVGAGEPPVEEYARHAGWCIADALADMGLPAEMERPFVRESYRLADKVLVHAGVHTTLNVLRARGVRTAVATGCGGDRARWLLDRLRLLPRFDVVLGGDEVPRPKPAPDIVHHALARLGVPAESAVVVGDGVADLHCAAAAGVASVAATWGESAAADLIAAGPHLVLRRPADLLTLYGIDRRTARVISLVDHDRRDCA